MDKQKDFSAGDGKLLRFGFRVEPMVRLTNGEVVAYELLCDGDHEFNARREWLWYLSVESLLLDLKAHGMAGDAAGRRISLNFSTRALLDIKIMQVAQSYINDSVILEWGVDLAACEEVERAAKVLRDLREKTGCWLAIDEVNQGPDGSHRVQLTQPELVKIDIKTAAERGRGLHQLKAMVESYRQQGIEVVVDWITNEQHQLLATMAGADYGQGWRWPRKRGLINQFLGEFSIEDIDVNGPEA